MTTFDQNLKNILDEISSHREVIKEKENMILLLRSESIDSIKSIIELFSFIPSDLFSKEMLSTLSSIEENKNLDSNLSSETPIKRKKIKRNVLYRHPEDPNLIWRGIGPRPKWFRNYIIQWGDSDETMRRLTDQGTENADHQNMNIDLLI